MARKKKAPAIKSNLRNLPDKKQRAIDRIGNIVTMIEITNDTDIKAYELEPEYRELTGGSSDFTTAKLSIVNETGNSINLFIPMYVDSEEFQGSAGSFEGFAGSGEFDIVLFKNHAMADFTFSVASIGITAIDGDIEQIEDLYLITGDATITIGVI